MIIASATRAVPTPKEPWRVKLPEGHAMFAWVTADDTGWSNVLWLHAHEQGGEVAFYVTTQLLSHSGNAPAVFDAHTLPIQPYTDKKVDGKRAGVIAHNMAKTYADKASAYGVVRQCRFDLGAESDDTVALAERIAASPLGELIALAERARNA